ncbi:hypothetical protein [uncultured Roseobacter sp.]|uniref:hypothetical protein n=1 Tax=uncultured Roseobacter sp. TaxID=114847 RepID=UPI00261C3E89|nr:hypothetical protein [uncultured Roseobacter sp.]
MTIHTEIPMTLYVALGEFDGTVSHLGECHTHISDAASEYVDAIEKGDITTGWVMEVQTGKDVTEAAKAAARRWMMERDQDYPDWLEASDDSVRWAAQ